MPEVLGASWCVSHTGSTWPRFEGHAGEAGALVCVCDPDRAARNSADRKRALSALADPTDEPGAAQSDGQLQGSRAEIRGTDPLPTRFVLTIIMPIDWRSHD